MRFTPTPHTECHTQREANDYDPLKSMAYHPVPTRVLHPVCLRGSASYQFFDLSPKSTVINMLNELVAQQNLRIWNGIGWRLLHFLQEAKQSKGELQQSLPFSLPPSEESLLQRYMLLWATIQLLATKYFLLDRYVHHLDSSKSPLMLLPPNGQRGRMVYRTQTYDGPAYKPGPPQSTPQC